jgi:acyl-CoA synthetase (AMP-forming)/AMP-acid ligase II
MIFRSPHQDVSIPETSLTEFVLDGAPGFADKPALIDGVTGRAITYSQLVESVNRVASALAHRGFKKGETLAIYSPNIPEYAIAFHAVASLGGIVTTINPLYTADELAHQIKDAAAKFLLVTPELLDKARHAQRESAVEEIIVFGEADGAISFDELLEHAGTPLQVAIDPRNDLVALPYSSGTTGLPKGVMLTHHNMIANLCQMRETEGITNEDTLVCVLPLFHIYGLQVIMNMGLRVGATIVMMPRFELEQFLKIIEEHRVTFAHIVPPIALALAKHPSIDQHDLSSLKTIMSAAAPLGKDLLLACAGRLDCFVKQGYGMTEASPATHMEPRGERRKKAGSVGLPVPNTEVKLINPDTGALCGTGQEGEIIVRGPQIMKGYLKNPDATRQTIDEEGWLHTGDIGYVDDDGYFWIVDRVKELIKYKGFQVAPAELEAILLTHPAVADAAVIPSPDPEAGEVPKAFVVLREDVDLDSIIQFVTAQVAPYKKIRLIETIDKIPKSPSGKILRRVLRDRDKEKRGNEK